VAAPCACKSTCQLHQRNAPRHLRLQQHPCQRMADREGAPEPADGKVNATRGQLKAGRRGHCDGFAFAPMRGGPSVALGAPYFRLQSVHPIRALPHVATELMPICWRTVFTRSKSAAARAPPDATQFSLIGLEYCLGTVREEW